MGGGRKTRSVSEHSLASFDADTPPAPVVEAPPVAEPFPPVARRPVELGPSSRTSLDERRRRWLKERDAAEAHLRGTGGGPG
jgi:hypothetical protein